MTGCAAAICQTAGTLAVSEVVTMTVVGIVGVGGGKCHVLTNTASAFTDGVTPDPNPANNQASLPTTITTAAALRVSKVALNNPIMPATWSSIRSWSPTTGQAMPRP